MRALMLTGPGNASVTDVDDPTPGPGQVVISVHGCGICGTDRHLFEGGHPHARYPLVPGHEFFGAVHEVGEPNAQLTVGTRVAVNPSRFCGSCRPCLEGRTNLCDSKGGYGIAFDGGFAELALVDSRYCIPVPDEVDDRRLVLAEPLACVLHAVDRLTDPRPTNALIVGAGPIGLLMAAVLRAQGTTEIAVVDRDSERQQLARDRLLDSEVLGIDELGSHVSRWDLVVDATGSTAAIEAAIGLVRKGGTMLVMGVPPTADTVQLRMSDYVVSEKNLITSFSLANSFGRSVDLLADPGFDIPELVTSVLGLEQFEDGLRRLGAPNSLKVMISPVSA